MEKIDTTAVTAAIEEYKTTNLPTEMIHFWEGCDLLQMPEKTLASYRSKDDFPRGQKVDYLWWWDKAEIEAWNRMQRRHRVSKYVKGDELVWKEKIAQKLQAAAQRRYNYPSTYVKVDQAVREARKQQTAALREEQDKAKRELAQKKKAAILEALKNDEQLLTRQEIAEVFGVTHHSLRTMLSPRYQTEHQKQTPYKTFPEPVQASTENGPNKKLYSALEVKNWWLDNEDRLLQRTIGRISELETN